MPGSVEDYFEVDSFDRDFYLWSLFLSAEQKLNNNWTMTLGAGHGQRPPTLTELYAMSSFIGSLQRGLTALNGDPLLKEERLTQIDFGLQGNFDKARFGAHSYFSWIDDMITYDSLSPSGGAGGVGGFPVSAQFVNTDHAILAGCEPYGEGDLLPGLTAFGTISYIDGRALGRNKSSRFGGSGDDRSGITDRSHESLPGITPLESRLGLRLHDPTPKQTWGLELAARIVDRQNRVATSLEEIQTPGFTTYDMRFFKRHGPWLFTAGIENITNKYYREHLDYRSGRGVFRPGVNFYSGVELTY